MEKSEVRSEKGNAPSAGLRGTATLKVLPEHTAQAFGSGSVPVFSTPRLVALMEEAAVNALAGRLEAGRTSVGRRIDISHLAATPVGQAVRAEAEIVSIDGRRIRFSVAAWDEAAKIGEGVHDRIVVDEQRFLDRIAHKAVRAR
jgi:predicted thioesterase